MSFWEDSSPIVKAAIIIGVIGLLYLGVAWGSGWGWFPFAPSCTHEVGGENRDGCPSDSECVEGSCVQLARGVSVE